MSQDEGSLRSLGRPPRRARKRDARTVPFPPTLGSLVSGQHARFEALLPPGVRSATTSSPGQAEAARRCSPGILTLQSSLHYGSGFGLSRRRTQGAEAPCYVHLRAPSHRGCIPRSGLRRLGSRTQDPSIRGVDRTPRITVERRPCSHTPHERDVRQSPAPSLGPFGLEDGASCPRPLSAAPRAFLPLAFESPRGGPDAGPRRRCVEPSTNPAPREASWRSHPFRSTTWSPVAGWTAARLTLASRAARTCPSRGQVSGGPPCCQVGRLSWAFVPRRNRLEGASLRRRTAYTSFGTRTSRPWRPYGRFTSGETPRHRDADDPS